ncbi:unnamed protein product [Vicia faba]|uniref:RRM domain-containing protein n=1 Tax=Vicia faba TaxID=3906 RepID=A0AAV1B145_VICFA|nr:unnamed protein product [Vicia faba]
MESVFGMSVSERRVSKAEDDLHSNFRRLISFYFTNVPEAISFFHVKKQFEVCGMLDDVYFACNRNKYGIRYGFARFINVKDVSKLLKALNNICFGHMRVWDRVAQFDKGAIVRKGKEQSVLRLGGWRAFKHCPKSKEG